MLIPHCTKKRSDEFLPVSRYCRETNELLSTKDNRSAFVSMPPPLQTATSEKDHPLPMALRLMSFSNAYFMSHMKFAVVRLYLSALLVTESGRVSLKEAFRLNL